MKNHTPTKRIKKVKEIELLDNDGNKWRIIIENDDTITHVSSSCMPMIYKLPKVTKASKK